MCPFDYGDKCFIGSKNFGKCPEKATDCEDYCKHLKKVLG